MIVLIWIALAILTALAAQKRGRGVWRWFFIGLLTGVFGLAAVFIMGEVPAGQSNAE